MDEEIGHWGEKSGVGKGDVDIHVHDGEKELEEGVTHAEQVEVDASKGLK